MRMRLRLNGDERQIDVEPSESLLFVLRERLGLYAAKNACEQGECGSCSILMDGDLICACLVMAFQAEESDIVTLEGLADDDLTRQVQDAMVECGAVQCGFCTPGFVVAARSLLERETNPSQERVREYLSGNLCRCTGYGKIVEAVCRVRDRRVQGTGR